MEGQQVAVVLQGELTRLTGKERQRRHGEVEHPVGARDGQLLSQQELAIAVEQDLLGGFQHILHVRPIVGKVVVGLHMMIDRIDHREINVTMTTVGAQRETAMSCQAHAFFASIFMIFSEVALR
ncbi:hypothetical protein D3C77_662590 [compost metagenome]